MLKTDYEREFTFNIDDYLIEWYPTMGLAVRRAICTRSLEQFETDYLEETVDTVVSDYCIEQQNLAKKVDEDDEEYDEEYDDEYEDDAEDS